jgi:DNA-binding transcriptional LysR family regulator
VARLGSFSRAAEALHLTQPAVSIQIRQITDSVGLPVRTERARDSPDRRRPGAAAHGPRAGRQLEPLRVGGRCPEALRRPGHHRQVFSAAHAGRFCQRYPDIEIELEVANRARIIERLRANEDDLYIMSFPPEELDVVATPFLDNPLVVVAPAAYPCPPARSAWPTWRPPLPAARNGSGTRKAVDRHLAANGLTLKVKLALGSNEAIRDLVASGMGLAILSATYWVSIPSRKGCASWRWPASLQQPWSVVHLRQKILSLPAHAFMNELLPAVRMAADTP